MKECSIEALVIKTADYGENDRVITFLSSEMGVFTAKARGVRKIGSKNAAALSLFCYSDVDLIQQNDFFSVKTASLRQSFHGISQSVTAFSAACYFAEAVCRFSADGDKKGDVMRLMLNALYLLEKPKERSVDFIKACFECKLLAISGFLREFDGCDICGKTCDRYLYDFPTDSILCAEDADSIPPSEKKYTFVVTSGTAEACNGVYRSQVNRFALFSLPADVEANFCAFCEKLLLHFADSSFATLRYYHEVMKFDETI